MTRNNDTHAQTVNFNRPPRIQPLALPIEDIDLPAPPSTPDMPSQSWIVSIIPVMGIGVMAIFYLMRASGGGGSSSALFAIPLVILAIFTIGGTILAQRWRTADYQKRRHEVVLNYIRILEQKRARLQAGYDAQIGLLEANFPKPYEGLKLALARDTRLWERRPDDGDFTAVRLGNGQIPSRIPIVTPDPDLDHPELDRAFALADRYRFLRDAPVVTLLRDYASLGICGTRKQLLDLVRSLICQNAIAHAPHDLQICLIAPPSERETWRWIEWLPHVALDQPGDAVSRVAFDLESTRALLAQLSQMIDTRKEHPSIAKTPHLLVIIDGTQLAEGEAVYATLLREGDQVGLSTLCLVNTYANIPGDCSALVDIAPNGQFQYVRAGVQNAEIYGATIEALSLPDAEHIARGLASVNMRHTGSVGRIPREVNFLELYGVPSAQALYQKLPPRWQRAIPDGVLPYPVPIGRESLAVETFMLLDEEHHGPHGVLAGTTGSGKSGLLQTLICALALEHDPRLVTFLLIDFKGGSTFNVFARLPHTVGTVTNLDAVLVERALEALKAEIQARQHFLKRMNVRDITQYHRYFSRTATHIHDESYRPLPHLFIIVDEFAQLAREMPDFMRELVRTAQIGRGLGLHLILGTQSPMDVITDEMNANLQFRICLRVQNIEASRAMLRRPDAAYLPAGWPGRGYFQVGERGLFKQFQAAYVGGDYRHALDDRDDETVLQLITGTGEVIDLLALGWKGEKAAAPVIESPLAEEPYTTVRAVVDTIAQYVQDQSLPAMPPILLPPLEDRVTLSTVLSPVKFGGWDGEQWTLPGRDSHGAPIRVGSAPIGLIDDIYNRTQPPLWIHLNMGDEHDTRKDGHLLILGGPGTGKTTLLQTLAISQAMLHPPTQLHMYFLSFTGGGLNEVARLPHAERVVHGTEVERVRRLFRRLITTLENRQSGRADDIEPVIMLCVDQYEQFRDTYFEHHVKDFERLIYEGRAAGIYVVMTASSISAIPDRLRSLIQQRIALQLGSASDYLLAVGQIGPTAERALPRGRGYVYNSPPLACQISLPCVHPAVADDDVRGELVALVDAMRTAYVGGAQLTGLLPHQLQDPAPITELPTVIPLNTLPAAQYDKVLLTPLGRCDDDTSSLFLLNWWENGPHFIVTGPPGSGKTNLLHTAALSAAQALPPDFLRFLLVDFTGRSLHALESLKHVLCRVTDSDSLEEQLAQLHAEMDAFYVRWQEHLNDPQENTALLIPKTVILIDDYDATSELLSGHAHVLRQLRDHARLHHEFGLHIWLAGYLERIGDPLIKHLLLRRSGFGLCVRDSLYNLNVRTGDLSPEVMPVGRAYFAQHNTVHVVQTALAENPLLLVNRINRQIWPEHPGAVWDHAAGTQAIRPSVVPPPGAPPSEGVSLDIDTDGLLRDLLGGTSGEEK